MPVNVEFMNFDKGLYLLGGRSEMPDGTMRIATATSPIHTGSVRSRTGSSNLDTSVQMVSVYRFYTNRVGVDTLGNLWWLPDSCVNYTTAWASAHAYVIGDIVKDSNNNFQQVTVAGTSGGSAPAWGTTQNGTTVDNTVTWKMIGGIVSALLFTAGSRVTFTKAPPQVGDTAYLFISGGGVVCKLDSSGNKTNWGIVAPADGMTAVKGTLASTTIDAMTATTGWTATNATLSQDTGFFVVSPGSLKLVCNPSVRVTLKKSITVNLKAFTSPVSNSYLQDIIQVYVGIDQPYLVDHIALWFSLGDTTFTYSYHKRVNIKVARNTAPNSTGMQDVWNLDNAVSGQTNLSKVYYNPNNNKIAVAPGERLGKHEILYDTNGGVVHGPEFTLWKFPKEVFVFTGPDQTTYGWADVKAVQWNIVCKSSSVKPNVWLNDLFMVGGSGMVGTYQYLVCFGNSTTGTLSNGNPTPVVIDSIHRRVVDLASIPVSTDPQVDERVILRTVGNGGYFYEDLTIADNTTTTDVDQTSDFFGMNGGTDPVGPNSTPNTAEPTLTGPIFAFVNNPPASTYTKSTVWQGTMFWCGDTATGCKGRIYYSTIGNSEGAASYTDISNDDDPTQALIVWNNQLYLFTTKAVYAIYQANDPNVVVNPSYPIPLFTGQLVTGAPGTVAPFSCASTPQGVVYQTNEGNLGIMNGIQTLPIAPQILQILRGESVEGYSAIGTIIAATYGKLEYVFSDGTQSFAYNMVDGAVRSCGIPFSAIYFEPDTGNFQASNGTQWWFLYEVAGTTTDVGTGIPFTVQTPSGYINGEKYTSQVRQVFVDANLNSQTLTATLLIDNASVTLNSGSTITNAARGMIELTTNQPGRITGLKLSGTLTGMVEIFRVAFDNEPAGAGDDSSASFQKQLKSFLGSGG